MKRLRQYWRRSRFGNTPDDSTDDESQQFPKLREFVYIDQRSVRSLLASTDSGRIAAEQTAHETDVETSERYADAGIRAGPANIGGGGRRASQQESGTENVYSFDLIQSKFTRLYEHEEITPRISISSEGKYELRSPDDDQLSMEDLERGTILELRGKIRLHPVYRVYRVIEYVENAAPEQQIEQEDTLQLIEDSLGEKIPVEIAVGGLSLTGDDEIKADSNGETINVVALLDKNELWTEPIQTLASNKQFRVYCRVEEVRPSWYPMKLIRVLESISPELADEYNTLLEGQLQAAMDAFETRVDAYTENTGTNERMVRDFVEFLAEEASESVNDEQVETIVDNTIASHSSESGVAIEQEVELQKTAYDEFISLLSEDLFEKEPHELRSEYHRDQYIRTEQSSDRDFTAHIEANVIGIYW